MYNRLVMFTLHLKTEENNSVMQKYIVFFFILIDAPYFI